MKLNMQSKNRMRRIVIGAITLLALAVPMTCAASDDLQQKIGIRPGGSGGSGGSSSTVNQQGDLRIDFRTNQSSYRVSEPISFSIRGSQTFYLYLFSISDRGEAVMLIPGPQQKGNKYQGNKTYRVPNAGSELFADRPGRERMVLVASTKWLDPGTNRYKSKGGFYTASAEVADATVKALRISSRQQQASHVTREVYVDIH